MCCTPSEETRREKLLQLYYDQKELLDTFLANGAITRAQYDRSAGDLYIKMDIEHLKAGKGPGDDR